MGNTTWFADHGYRLWLANWNVSSPTVPANGWQGRDWTFWQWTHKPLGSALTIPAVFQSGGIVIVFRLRRARFDGACPPVMLSLRFFECSLRFAIACWRRFLSFALAWAEVLGAQDVFIGVNALDYSGYPDCRPEYIAAFQRLADLATKAGVEGSRLRIHTPLIRMTKAEIIRKGRELGVDFDMTLSCYDPTPAGEPCGRCDACQLRAKGFAEASV